MCASVRTLAKDASKASAHGNLILYAPSKPDILLNLLPIRETPEVD